MVLLVIGSTRISPFAKQMEPSSVPIMDTMAFLMLMLPWLLFDNAEPQIGSRRGLEYPRSFQFHLLIDERLEKAKTFTKEDRDDANVDFVNQPGS